METTLRRSLFIFLHRSLLRQLVAFPCVWIEVQTKDGLPEEGLVWRHLTATKSRDAAAPPGCERHQLHENYPHSQIAICICLKVPNIFVLSCKMYLSHKKLRCCLAASATSFTLSSLHLVHPLKKGFPDSSCFLRNRRIEKQFEKSFSERKIPNCCGQLSNSLSNITLHCSQLDQRLSHNKEDSEGARPLSSTLSSHHIRRFVITWRAWHWLDSIAGPGDPS